jgi:hypothetical protein
MLKLIFDGHIPSKKNSKRFVRRGKRMVSIPSKAYEEWHNTWMSAWSNLPTVTEPVKISYEFWVGGVVSPREFDFSNAEESINDLLVDLGVIQDDSWLYLIEKHSKLKGFVRGASRTVVKIEQANLIGSDSPPDNWQTSISILKDKSKIKEMAQAWNISQKAVTDSIWEELKSMPEICT